jgi:predicted RNase H-like HicB family nuclease
MQANQSRNEVRLSNLVLRCYAEQEADGTWFAICLSLNLYARGDSFEQARMKLHAVIASYLKDALTVDSQYVGDLIPRRAPLYFWVRYAFVWCALQLRDVATKRQFKESLPLVPAL